MIRKILEKIAKWQKIYKNIAKGYKIVDTSNFRLLGKTHPKTGVKYVLKRLKYSSGEMIQGVFPVFKLKQMYLC